MLYIVIAIFMFGLLIAIHELGHFATAKLLGVRVNEFAIGMGPVLWQSRKKSEEPWEDGKTLYSLRLLPIGGFCAMEGEDEDSDDPHAFGRQAAWKKVIILSAGALMNFLAGLVLLLVVFSQAQVFTTPVITRFMDGFPLEGEQGLMAGDRIVSIDGHAILLSSDVSIFLSRSGGDTVDLVVERGGEKIILDKLPLTPRTYVVDGQEVLRYGLYFGYEEATLGAKLKYTALQAADDVRIVWYSLGEIFRGAVGLRDLSGPVGIINMVGQAGEQGAQDAEQAGQSAFFGALMNILNFASLIAINLAVMNLLPLPALDGGRIFFLLVNGVWMLLTRRRIDPKYEGYVHFAGLVALMALMVVVALSDVARLLGR